MTVTTEHFYTGNGSTTTFAYTFPYYQTSDIKVTWDDVLKTEGSHYNVTGTNIVFTSGNIPGNNVVVHIFRKTDVDASKATFAAGSSIRATDLNNNELQLIYAAQERQGQTILTGDIKDDQITNIKILDGTVTTANLANNAVNADKIATGAVDTTELADDAVTSVKIEDNAVTMAKLGAGTLPSDVTVSSANIPNNTIVANDLANDSVTTAKITDSNVTSSKLATDAVTTAKIQNLAVTSGKIADNAITSSKIAANTIAAADIGDDAITTNAILNDAVTGDKIAHDTISTVHIGPNAVGSSELADSSVDTDAIQANAVTQAKIASNAVGQAQLADDAVGAAELATDAVVTASITNLAVTTPKLGNDAVTQDKIADNAIGQAQMQDNSIGQAEVQDNAIGTNEVQNNAITDVKIANNAVTTAKIDDAELTTLAGMQSGTASVLASGTTLTSSIAELNLLDGKSVVTAVSGTSTDAQLPTAKAVNDQIVALMQDAGGYFPIADDQSFPNANPDPNDDAGTIVSIADAGGLVVNGSGVTTTGRTLGGATVTINGIDSTLYSTTIAAGKGMLVQTTSTLNTYTYHRLVVDEAGVAGAQTLVSDFNQRYRVGSSNPTSSLDDGDLFFNTSSNKMLVYNATDSSWDEVQSVGNFFINTISSYSGTGGNSATFNGSAYRFVLSNAPTNAQQLLVSVNGVVQKTNSGTSQPSEGFAIDGSSIIFSSAPASGSDYFIVTIGSTVNIGTPSNNTVTSAILQNGSVSTDKLVSGAVTGDKVANNLDLADNKKIRFGTGNDLEIYHDGSHSRIHNSTGALIHRTASYYHWYNSDASETLAQFNVNGSCDLYYDGQKKFSTKSDGVKLDQGHFYADDSSRIKLGDSEDLVLYHDGSNSYIKDAGTGELRLEADAGGVRIQRASGHTGIYYNVGGQVDLYYDNSKKFETASTGAKWTGDLFCNDDNYIKLGDGGDLQLFHDGTWSYVRATNGNLAIQAKSGENSVVCIPDGKTALYHDNSEKLYTQADGVHVTGDLSVNSSSKFYGYDNTKVSLGHSNDLQLYHDGTNSIIDSNTGDFLIRHISGSGGIYIDPKLGERGIIILADGSTQLYYDNSKKLETTSAGVTVSGTCTATSFAGDGSNLTGVSSVGGATGVDFNDSVKARFGTGNDLEIYHDGTNAVIKHTPDANHLLIQGDSIKLQDYDNAHNYITCAQDGAVELYYDNSKKLETKSTGVKATGELEVTSNLLLKSSTSQRLYFGANNDLQIYHNGSNGQIDNSTGNLELRNTGSFGSERQLQIKARVDENSIVCKSDGAVELYYDNSKKFETITTGTHVTTNHDIRFANGSWTGDTYGKIQHHSNILYMCGGSNGFVWKNNTTEQWIMEQNGTFRPITNNTYDLGGSSHRIRNLYTADLQMSNEGSANEVDGTWGNYTIQEGENDLFLLNRRNGKKYKFNLTEIVN